MADKLLKDVIQLCAMAGVLVALALNAGADHPVFRSIDIVLSAVCLGTALCALAKYIKEG